MRCVYLEFGEPRLIFLFFAFSFRDMYLGSRALTWKPEFVNCCLTRFMGGGVCRRQCEGNILQWALSVSWGVERWQAFTVFCLVQVLRALLQLLFITEHSYNHLRKIRHGFFSVGTEAQAVQSTILQDKRHCGCTSIFHHCAKDAKVKHNLKEDVQCWVHISKIARLKCSPGVVGTVNLLEKKSLVMLPEICPDSSRDAAFESFHSHWVGVLVMPLSYPLFC